MHAVLLESCHCFQAKRMEQDLKPALKMVAKTSLSQMSDPAACCFMSSISLSDWSDKALTTVDASGAGDATLPNLEVLAGRTAAPGRANWR